MAYSNSTSPFPAPDLNLRVVVAPSAYLPPVHANLCHAMKATVLWIDGCFDGFHYAHANAARQARSLVEGPVHLMAGVHSDVEVFSNKGPTLFAEAERYALIRACRWVDEVIEGVPYSTQLSILDTYKIDFVVHGDDIALDSNGIDCFALVKSIGRYKEFKRTEGISTTSLIDRLLNPSLEPIDKRAAIDTDRLRQLLGDFALSCNPSLPILDLREGAGSTSSATPLLHRNAHTGARRYIAGGWDCFGSAHVELLRRAKEEDSEANSQVELVVGIWSDEDARCETGLPPLYSLLERALIVAQCRHTGGIILSPPRTITEELIQASRIDLVVDYLKAHQGIPCAIMSLENTPTLPTRASLTSSIETRRASFEERQRRRSLHSDAAKPVTS